MFFIVLIVLVSYLCTGSVLARRDYANRVALAAERNVTEEVEAKRKEMSAISHNSSCWRGPTYRSKTRGCDCGGPNQIKWRRLNTEIETLKSNGIVVGGPYKVLFWWPAVLLDSFLKGGTVKQPKGLLPKDWEQRMEQELLDLDS